ncbi:hypothetical protein [Puniceibacterium sediminis]|uniref:Uncharacterized protein n=1 Tax=Puniceibacterium sediminis TaxID=1608407 RepID=A0A238UX23_9RHOB|nr:hypothetical protein [Puniceibacterium sediminis]SNR26760.1 hypothetical protein SAMN06265370_101283 [Puniceibacterium sediminis]
MSAPDTNTTTEEKRHKPSILGMKAVLIFVAILLVGWLVWTVSAADAPDGAKAQIDGRTGEEVQTE